MLALVYSTVEYCAPAWCRSAHTRLINSVLNDALRNVTGCLRPTPTGDLSTLAGIQPAELRRLGATLSLAYQSTMRPDHILHDLLAGPSDIQGERLQSRRPFVSAGRSLLSDLSKLDIRPSEWMDYKWNMEYSNITSELHEFVPKVTTSPMGTGLPRQAWVVLNRLRTGVGRFKSSMHKWGLAPKPTCEYGASEQTASHIIPRLLITPSTAGSAWTCGFGLRYSVLAPKHHSQHLSLCGDWGGKKIDPRPQLVCTSGVSVYDSSSPKN